MFIVIGTNLWVSGLLWQGLPWRLLRLAEQDQVTLCMTPTMVAELAEVLTYERLHPRLQQLELTPADLIAHVLTVASLFDVPDSAKVPMPINDFPPPWGEASASFESRRLLSVGP